MTFAWLASLSTLMAQACAIRNICADASTLTTTMRINCRSLNPFITRIGSIDQGFGSPKYAIVMQMPRQQRCAGPFRHIM
jgi:hypothetical protein